MRQAEQARQQTSPQVALTQDQRDSAALKQLLLALNFTATRAAALLDAAGPSTPQQLQDIMHQYQELFCRWGVQKRSAGCCLEAGGACLPVPATQLLETTCPNSQCHGALCLYARKSVCLTSWAWCCTGRDSNWNRSQGLSPCRCRKGQACGFTPTMTLSASRSGTAAIGRPQSPTR
jgi:hypothetical protein